MQLHPPHSTAARNLVPKTHNDFLETKNFDSKIEVKSDVTRLTRIETTPKNKAGCTNTENLIDTY